MFPASCIELTLLLSIFNGTISLIILEINFHSLDDGNLSLLISSLMNGLRPKHTINKPDVPRWRFRFNLIRDLRLTSVS
jgi:hypothetical protein